MNPARGRVCPAAARWDPLVGRTLPATASAFRRWLRGGSGRRGQGKQERVRPYGGATVGADPFGFQAQVLEESRRKGEPIEEALTRAVRRARTRKGRQDRAR